MSRVPVVAMALLGLVACAAPNMNTIRIDGIPVSTHQTASADGTLIHYRRAGHGTTALVFVHGWSCDQSYWDAQWSAFVSDFTVISLDLAGHGLSDSARTDWSMAHFGDDVAAVVRDANLSDVVLVGHSMGGNVMLEAAQRLPGTVRHMMGVDTLKDPNAGLAPDAAQDLWAAFVPDFPAAVDGFVRTRFFLPEADPALVDTIARDMAAAPQAAALAMGMKLSEHRVADALLGTRDVPLVLINAAQPPTDEAGYIMKRNNVTFVYLDKTGHFPMREDPDAFARALRSALRSTLRSALP